MGPPCHPVLAEMCQCHFRSSRVPPISTLLSLQPFLRFCFFPEFSSTESSVSVSLSLSLISQTISFDPFFAASSFSYIVIVSLTLQSQRSFLVSVGVSLPIYLFVQLRNSRIILIQKKLEQRFGSDSLLEFLVLDRLLKRSLYCFETETAALKSMFFSISREPSW